MDETRFNQYKELFEKGLTYEEVGEAMGVTRQRAHAIYKRYFQNTLKSKDELLKKRRERDKFNKAMDVSKWPRHLQYVRKFCDFVPDLYKQTARPKLSGTVNGKRVVVRHTARTFSDTYSKHFPWQIKVPSGDYDFLIIVRSKGNSDDFDNWDALVLPKEAIEKDFVYLAKFPTPRYRYYKYWNGWAWLQ
jgi:predicted transcriptional regulator